MRTRILCNQTILQLNYGGKFSLDPRSFFILPVRRIWKTGWHLQPLEEEIGGANFSAVFISHPGILLIPLTAKILPIYFLREYLGSANTRDTILIHCRPQRFQIQFSKPWWHRDSKVSWAHPALQELTILSLESTWHGISTSTLSSRSDENFTWDQGEKAHLWSE